MQLTTETTMNFQVDVFDRMEIGSTFIGTEIFPAVLHSMLDEVEEKGYSHIASWQPHGRCFVVHNRKEFVRLIMPVYFRMSKFASFQRQLNLYDYKRITSGPDKGGYYHENFVRGQKRLCKYIVRQQVKGTLTRKPAPETEPDFYRLGMMRCANTAHMKMVGPQEDITSPTRMSDLVMNARGHSNSRTYSMPNSSMFSNTLVARPGFSNTYDNQEPMSRQQHTKMTLEDLQGPDAHSWIAGVRCQEFCNNPSVPSFGQAPSFETHNPKPDSCNTGNEAVVTMFRSPRYALCEGTERLVHVPNPDPPSYMCNQSIISMLCPSRYSRCDETKTMSHNMNNCAPQFMANEQPSKTYHGNFDNQGNESFSTSFFPGPMMDTPAIDEPFGTTNSNTFFNESSHFGWTP